MHFDEFSQLGWNMLTFSFFAILLSIVAGVWAFWQQNKAIWSTQSGESLSVTFFAYLAAFYCSLLAHGISTHTFALIFASVQIIPCLGIVIGLWKFKGFTRNEYLICSGLFLLVGMMMLSENKALFMTCFLFGRSAFTVPQILELWQTKKVGALSIKMLLINELKSTFWSVYSFEIKDWALFWPSFTLWCISAITIGLWYFYHHKEKEAPS